MKIEQLLVQHLYDKKEVTLQGIGTLTLSPDIVFPADTDKDFVIPPNAISFSYNTKATEDDALINFIVQQTRKIRPLASADLDSYLVLGKQFLNIGKPFRIEGIGTLQINQQGHYEFLPGNFVMARIEAAPLQMREKAPDADISFATEGKAPRNKKVFWIIAAIVLLGLAGWGGWYLLNMKKENTTSEQTEPAKPVLPNDSVASKNPDSVSKKPIAPTTGEYNFKIVFEETQNKAAAEKRMNDLIKRGHKVIMYTSDSVTFKLAEPYTLPLSDTTHIKDSLGKWYYSGKARVEL